MSTLTDALAEMSGGAAKIEEAHGLALQAHAHLADGLATLERAKEGSGQVNAVEFSQHIAAGQGCVRETIVQIVKAADAIDAYLRQFGAGGGRTYQLSGSEKPLTGSELVEAMESADSLRKRASTAFTKNTDNVQSLTKSTAKITKTGFTIKNPPSGLQPSSSTSTASIQQTPPPNIEGTTTPLNPVDIASNIATVILAGAVGVDHAVSSIAKKWRHHRDSRR